jgi:two-component system sensor histidine kinase CpxA
MPHARPNRGAKLEQMSKLVNDVLAFSKAGLRTPDVPLSNIHIADVVRNVLEREVGQPVLIKDDVPADLYARANLDLLDRALANIVRNAVRYAGADGPISITARSDGGLVSIRVADCGPGLPESDLDRVFDPFFRLEFSRGSDSGGVGLGLAIVKSCIEACEGSVVCRNRSQGGLEIEMTLKPAV